MNRAADTLPFAETDAVGPFVVNEFRQRFRNPSFALVPPLLALVSAVMAGTLWFMQTHDLLPRGGRAVYVGPIAFSSIYLLTLFYTVVMIPLEAFQLMQRDCTGDTWAELSLTQLTPRVVVTDKLLSSLWHALLAWSAVLPFIGACLFMPGMSASAVAELLLLAAALQVFATTSTQEFVLQLKQLSLRGVPTAGSSLGNVVLVIVAGAMVIDSFFTHTMIRPFLTGLPAVLLLWLLLTQTMVLYEGSIVRLTPGLNPHRSRVHLWRSLHLVGVLVFFVGYGRSAPPFVAYFVLGYGLFRALVSASANAADLAFRASGALKPTRRTSSAGLDATLHVCVGTAWVWCGLLCLAVPEAQRVLNAGNYLVMTSVVAGLIVTSIQWWQLEAGLRRDVFSVASIVLMVAIVARLMPADAIRPLDAFTPGHDWVESFRVATLSRSGTAGFALVSAIMTFSAARYLREAKS